MINVCTHWAKGMHLHYLQATKPPQKRRGMTKKHLNVTLDDIYTACNIFIRINSQAHMSSVQARIKATQNYLLGSDTQVNIVMQIVFFIFFIIMKKPCCFALLVVALESIKIGTVVLMQ